jgi:hypothetical protein
VKPNARAEAKPNHLLEHRAQATLLPCNGAKPLQLISRYRQGQPVIFPYLQLNDVVKLKKNGKNKDTRYFSNVCKEK